MPDPQPDAGNDVGVSPFALQDAFPDAQGIFTARHRTLEEIKDDCFVVLDANVLLLPYKLEEVSLPDVIAVYRPLAEAGRLVIPAQAAREFAKHRSSKVAELVRYLRSQAGLAGPDLKRKVGALVGHTDYDAAKSLVSVAAEKVKELQTAINKLADGIAANVGEDPVSIAYRDVFGSAVSTDPIEASDEKAFQDELKKRYAAGRPPGFKDKAKADGGAGDLIIWKTILVAGASRQTNCIFVTGDEKADWYVQSGGPFQPRLELIEEYRAHSNGTLHILPLSALLRTMNVSTKTVQDVERAEVTIEIATPGIWNAADRKILNDDRSGIEPNGEPILRAGMRLRRKNHKLQQIADQLSAINADLDQTYEALNALAAVSDQHNAGWSMEWRAQQDVAMGLMRRKRMLLELQHDLEQPD